MATIYNTTGSDIELIDFGITVPALDISDVNHIRRAGLKASTELYDYILDGTLKLVKEEVDTLDQYWSTEDALQIVQHGVNGNQVGINKPTRPGIIDGNYYGPSTDSDLIDDTVPANHINAIPVNYLGVYFNRIGICVTNAVANSEVRLGVYSNNNGLPGDLLLDAGVVPTDTIGNKEIVIDFNTPTDWCFLTTHSSHLIGALSVASQMSVFGNTSNSVTEITRHIHDDLTYTGGGLPASFPNTAVASNQYPPFVWFRKV